MSSFTKMMRNIVMSIEIVSFFSILINACIVLIEKQKEHYLIGTAILMFNVIALGIALVNDLLKDKVLVEWKASSWLKFELLLSL